MAVWLTVWALALVGCGAEPSPDASTDGADDAADGSLALPPPPVMPAPPALPELTPCGEGFSAQPVADAEGLVLCAPAEASECGEGTYPFVDGCRGVDFACPTGAYAEAPTEAPVLYVDAAAAAGGDGTMASPYATFAEALAAAPSDGVLLLASGAYVVETALARDIHVIGACPERTTLTHPADGGPVAVITMTAGEVFIEGVTIRGDVVGARVDGGTLTMRHVVVTGMSIGGVVTNLAGQAVLEDVAIVGTRPGSAGLGSALVAFGGGQIAGTRLAVTENHSFALGANGPGSRLDLESVRVGDTRSPTEEGIGAGASVVGQGAMHCRGCVFEHNLGVGIQTEGLGSMVVLEDSLVDDTQIATLGNSALGVIANDRADLQMTRVGVTRSPVAAVTVGAGASAQLVDVVIHETDLDAGLVAYARTSLEAQRLAIVEARGVALNVIDPNATATLVDLTIERVAARESDGFGGRAMQVALGAEASIERARIRDSLEVALFVEEAAVTMRDVSIERTRAKGDGVGRGVNVQGGSFFDADRLLVSESVEVGVFVFDEGTEATLNATTIRDTAPRACSADECDEAAGIGVVSVNGAMISMSDFLLERNAFVGLQMLRATTVWRDGVVRDHPIGVNLQDSPTDPEDLIRGVFYIDNQQNLDASALPVPAPAVASGS